MKKVTFEVCDCGAATKHGYFYIDGDRHRGAIGSVPNGAEVLAAIATENELSDEDVASAKAQLEAAGLATEVLEEERPVPPELAELLEFLQSMGGRVTVLKI